MVPFISWLLWYQRQQRAKVKRNAVKQLLGQLLWDPTGHGRNPAFCGMWDLRSMTQPGSVSTGSLPIEEEGVLRFILLMWKKAGNMKIDADINNVLSSCLGEKDWLAGTQESGVRAAGKAGGVWLDPPGYTEEDRQSCLDCRVKPPPREWFKVRGRQMI